MRRLIPLLALLALLAPLAAGPRPAGAAAGKWAFGDTRYFTITETCRDGLRLAAGWDKVNSGGLPPPAPGDTQTIGLGVRLATVSFAAPYDASDGPASRLGPLLYPSTTVTMTYHAEPIVADITGGGSTISFNVYAEETVTWPRLLAPGDRVLLASSDSAAVDDLVADCYLNRLAVDHGATVTITRAHLGLDPRIAAPEATTYRLTSLPLGGALRLNGTPLAVGGIFGQGDIDGGRLTYAHAGGPGSGDSFGFSVSALALASVSGAGAQASGPAGFASAQPSISFAGTRVAFESTATNLVASDSNGVRDVFVRDLAAGTTVRASVRSAGGQADGASSDPAITASGQGVAFTSEAANLGGETECLVDGTDAAQDVYLRRLDVGSTSQLSVGPYLWGKCLRANGSASAPAAGSDFGPYAFASTATNQLRYRDNANALQGRADTNGAADIFRQAASFYQSSSVSLVSQGNGISGTDATGGASGAPAIASDRGSIAFASTASGGLIGADTNGISDIFVRDGTTTRRVSLTSAGGQAAQAVATCFPFLGGQICLKFGSTDPDISADGRFVVFASYADNLVAGDTNERADIFLHDRDTDGDGLFDEPGAFGTLRISAGPRGAQADGNSAFPAISPDGRYIAYESDATNLVSGDTNGTRDIFLYDRQEGTTRRISVGPSSQQASGPFSYVDLSLHGEYAAFDTTAALVPADTNGARDVYVRYNGFSSSFVMTILPPAAPPPGVFVPLVTR